MIVNPQEFRRSALHFIKHGVYCHAPYKSKDYYEYWNEEKRRCIEGYSVGGYKVPGKYYFYLNYFPMMRKPSVEDKARNKVSSIQTKILSFADFWKIQHDWHVEKQAAWDRPFGMGNHILCFKTRGCGWSYMDACEGVYNYNFIPKAKSFYLAMLEKYLLGEDGILWKCWDGLDHLNKHTDGFWLKNRHEIDTQWHKRASFKEQGAQFAKGYKSEISGIIVDNPRKVRGARGIKITFEEVGSLKNFLKCIEAARPLVEEGQDILGQISAFGTGGEEGPYIEDAEKVFDNPLMYNFAGFDNEYEDDGMNDTIGYFVPADIATPGFFDTQGNPKREEARAFWEAEYAKKEKDPKARDLLMAERPLKPSHVFRRASHSIFDKNLATAQKKRILRDRGLLSMIKRGDLVPSETGWKFMLTNDREVPYPHSKTDRLDGCISIVYPPTKEAQRYILVHDPYYKDDAEDVTSLGSSYVIDLIQERIVAWYNGRPTRKEIYLRKMFSLAEYYQATIQSEISGGGQDVINYARTKRKMHMLEYEVEMWDKTDASSKKRSYLMNMATERKANGIIYFADWLITERSLNEDGTPVFQIEKVFDLELLEEIIRYKDGKNADRISAMIVGMYMIKEKSYLLKKRKEQENRNKNTIFDRPIFTDTPKNKFNLTI